MSAADEGQRLTLSETVGELDPGYERAETRLEWGAALARLQARERKVLLMRFGGECTQSEIATRIGVSQMQVSRILRGIPTTLAAALE